MASKLVTRECEIKSQIESKERETEILTKIEILGFSLRSSQRELDFCPDTPDSKCKTNGLLLRIRRILTDDGSQDILLTLKVKRTFEGIKDDNEIQFYFSAFSLPKLELINTYLEKAGAIKLGEEIRDIAKFESLKDHLHDLGYTKLRSLIEKRRREYFKKRSSITLDEFPENIGKYIEIETESPNKLFRLAKYLGINDKNRILIDYGDLIKVKKKELSDEEQRTCLFPDSLTI